MNANLARMLVRSARAYPDEAAVFDGSQPIATFGQLADRAARCARGLRHWLGLARGDRVALVMENRPPYIELLYGIWHAGLCAVPIDATLPPREIEYILLDSGARRCFGADGAGPPAAGSIVVGSPTYRALFDVPGIPVVDVGEDDPAWLFYTSGATGRPTRTLLSHHNLAAMAWAYGSAVTPIVPGDSFSHAAPLSWLGPRIAYICGGAEPPMTITARSAGEIGCAHAAGGVQEGVLRDLLARLGGKVDA